MSKPIPDLFDLSGRVAVVTGASRGIGESIARTLAAYGAHVVVSSRKIDGCEAIAASIRDSGGKATAFACHIGELDQIDRLMAEVDSKLGRLDVLVNNAATNPHFGPLTDVDASVFQKTVDVNIRGYFFMSSAGMKRMVKAGGGSIINVASINGVIPAPLQGIYSITKAAVISMTKAFAREGGPHNVRANALLPGLTDTKFASVLVNTPAILQGVLPHIPMNRVAQPDEMAGAVLYLASDASSYTTGITLNVDGGYLSA